MSMDTQTRNTQAVPFGAITAHEIATAVMAFFDGYRRRSAVRRTLDEIAHLDARQLDDIGITPEALERFTRTGRL